jgi:hypothetical protein
MKVKKETEVKFILEISEMEMACIQTALRKANAEFISRNSEGDGYPVYEDILKKMYAANKR